MTSSKGRRLRRMAVLAAALVLLAALSLHPRSLTGSRPQSGRTHESKHRRPPRHLVPDRSGEMAKQSGEKQAPLSRIRREELDEKTGMSPSRPRRPLPAAAQVVLTKPRYLQLFSDPHLQTCPPA